MDELSILKECIAEDAYHKEALAIAITLYLERHFPGAHSEIMNTFDNLINNRCNNAIKERLEELDGITIG